jgi:hypothetical protein
MHADSPFVRILQNKLNTRKVLKTYAPTPSKRERYYKGLFRIKIVELKLFQAQAALYGPVLEKTGILYSAAVKLSISA